MKLRDGEQMVATAQFHWSAFVGPALISLWMTMITITTWPKSPVIAFLAPVPLLYAALANRMRTIAVTTERVFIRQGVLSQMRKEVPLTKINNVELGQSITGRLFGAYTVSVFSGNDKPILLKGISKGEEFYDAISAHLAQKTKAA